MASSFPRLPPATIEQVHALAREGSDLRRARPTPSSRPLWAALRKTGTELWLDTGDLEGAEKLWAAELTALTTNNTLLNAEVQKGIYDDLIRRAAGALGGVDPQLLVLEIAFLLNARHGLRLAERFGGKVSVELHTALADHVDATVEYGRRFYRICPEHFIVKVPLTPAGLISARRLRLDGIPINFTLGFSARQNYLAAALAGPSYVNVFLGRINAYFSDNGLGDGKQVGEKATLASQRAVRLVSRGRKEPTLQIAASMRGASQVADLAGVDVYTMPLKVAEAALKEVPPTFTSRTEEDPAVSLAPGTPANRVRSEVLWDLSSGITALGERLALEPPSSAEALVAGAAACGVGDLFPSLSANDLATLGAEGKIPRHATWASRIEARELAIDTLLNVAGLLSFKADQKALDDRIRRLIG